MSVFLHFSTNPSYLSKALFRSNKVKFRFLCVFMLSSMLGVNICTVTSSPQTCHRENRIVLQKIEVHLLLYILGGI